MNHAGEMEGFSFFSRHIVRLCYFLHIRRIEEAVALWLFTVIAEGFFF